MGLQPQEVDLIFNAMAKIEGSKYGTESKVSEGYVKGFSYRQFIKVFLKFKNFGQAVKLLNIFRNTNLLIGSTICSDSKVE